MNADVQNAGSHLACELVIDGVYDRQQGQIQTAL